MTRQFIHTALLALFVLCNATLLVAAKPGPSSAGALDASFGTGGKVTTAFGPSYDEARAVVVQTDGKIIAAGKRQLSKYDDTDFALARYTTGGAFDSKFGTGGKVVTDIGVDTQDFASAVVVQSDGRIIAVGSASIGGALQFAVTRYNANGTLDTGFGNAGKVTTAFGTLGDGAFAVVLQMDGKIVVAGYTTTGNGPSDFALARYNFDGTLDRTFGSRGKVMTHLSGRAKARGVVLQPDGKIVLAGEATNGDSDTTRHFALARYNTAGTLDASFGSGGIVITGLGSSADEAASGIALQTDGRMVLAGTEFNGPSGGFVLARYNSNGTLDPTFGSGGNVIMGFGTPIEGALSVALQSDGRIIAAGYANIDGATDFALARYSVNGNLDTTFGSGGKVTTGFGTNSDLASAVAIQSDGRVVAAGYAVLSNTGMDFALARYLP
jgi:uncharacterized delta-60 repeat protein